MDIGNGKGPSFSQLSTNALHNFAIDGVHCSSLESFIQSLKFEKATQAASVCADKPKVAKERGKKLLNWGAKGCVYWKGEAIARGSHQHIALLEGALNEVARQCPAFKVALVDTGNTTLTCAGKSHESDTPVTEAEFCKALTRVRGQLLSRQRSAIAAAELEQATNSPSAAHNSHGVHKVGQP